MDYQNDPELENLFRQELDERSRSLIEGADAMLSGEITSEISGRMLREGHTIKGTGRVMGYEAIARGGETCEFVWRFVNQGDLESSAMLARTLNMLARAIPAALDDGPDEISESIDMVRSLITDDEMLKSIPEPLSGEVADADSSPDGAAAVDSDAPSVVVELVDRPSTDADAEDSELSAETVPEAVAEVATEDAAEEPEDIPEAVDDVPTEDPEPEPSEQAEDEESVVNQPLAVVEAPPNETVVEESADLDPLVFEPGPNGKLSTPTITYEFISEDSVDEPAPAGTPEAEIAERSTEVRADGPPSLTVVDGTGSVLDPVRSQPYDLGGLVGAVEAWAAEESVPVNAGRLFRMINDVVAVRIDMESTIAKADAALGVSSSGSGADARASAREALSSVQKAAEQLEASALNLTVVPVSSVTSTLPQLVKYLSKRLDREVRIEITGQDTPIDRQLIDRIGEIIRQLVVNAVSHGLESAEDRAARGKPTVGSVSVTVGVDNSHIVVTVADDGAGIDWPSVKERAFERGLVGEEPTTDELRSVLYTEGFSTNPESSEFTGTGSGLSRVTDIVEEVYGSMSLKSRIEEGTTFEITMPAHRALQRAQMFSAGGRVWGIPDSVVVAVMSLPDVAITVTKKGSTIGYGELTVPYASFAAAAGLGFDGVPSSMLIIQSPSGVIALAVDEVLETHEVVTKELSPLLSGSSVVSGVALLGGEETVMLVDAGRLVERMHSMESDSHGPVRKVLVVDDSKGVRQVVSGVLASHGFSTVSAGSVSEALAAFAHNDVDALVVDFSMPRADGVALVHMVRHRYGRIPIVMLSGVASSDDRDRAERAGVDAFFDKSEFARGALVEKLSELIQDKDSANSEPQATTA